MVRASNEGVNGFRKNTRSDRARTARARRQRTLTYTPRAAPAARRRYLRDELRAARVRHHDVGEQAHRCGARRDLQRFVGVARDQHGVAALLERPPRKNADVLRVLDDEHCLVARGSSPVLRRVRGTVAAIVSAAGSVIVNVVPCPSSLSTATVPPD